MPDAAKVDFFVRKLLHSGDDRKARDAADERVFHRRANGLGEGQELPGRQRLVAEKDDAMRQPRTTQRRQVILAQRPGQVEPGDFRTQRAGQPGHGQCRGTHADNSASVRNGAAAPLPSKDASALASKPHSRSTDSVCSPSRGAGASLLTS